MHHTDARDDLPFMVHSELDDIGLDPHEFRVYAHAVRRANARTGEPANAGAYYESVTTAAKICRMSIKKYRASIHRLVSMGLLTAAERPGRTTEYRLTPKREWRVTPAEPLPKQTGVPLPETTGVENVPLPNPTGAPTQNDRGTPTQNDRRRESLLRESPQGKKNMLAKNGEDLETTYEAIKGIWNEHRGTLPAITAMSLQRQRALRKHITEHGPLLTMDLFRAATQAVAADPWWQKHGYGFDNLLTGNKLLARAEQWRNGTPALGAADTALAHTALKIAQAINATVNGSTHKEPTT